jgi:putative spermidine/putrescine transport system ATP-binding protein
MGPEPRPQAAPIVEAVRLEAVAKSFGGRQVLSPTTLVIEEGRKVVLLGPSGCGKTTTLRLIAGLERPDPGGRVLIGGVDVTGLPPERREIGMMFQNYALFPNMSVEANVGYGLKIRKVPRKERELRVQELLALTRLETFAKAEVTKLSGGQRQRVALARALATGPKVLLLDEPLGALDAALRESVREELDELLSKLAITTVIVTHDQEEAMSLGDVIVVMREGAIEQAGRPAQIYDEPASAFVAGFVGGSNKIDAEISDGFLRLPGDVAIPLSLTRRRGAATEEPFAPVGRASVFFRPGKATLAEAAPGRLRGRVVSSRFLGGATRLVVGLDERHRVKMELPGTFEIQAGAEVGLELAPEALMLFEEA